MTKSEESEFDPGSNSEVCVLKLTANHNFHYMSFEIICFVRLEVHLMEMNTF